MKQFNTTAVCIPEKHYMVDVSDKIAEIRKLVDAGKYFTINRARQYGKTTTLYLLGRSLRTEYEVLNLSFEGISESGFATEEAFVKAFCRLLRRESLNGLVLPDFVREEIIQGKGWQGAVSPVPEAYHQWDRKLLYRSADEGSDPDRCGGGLFGTAIYH